MIWIVEPQKLPPTEDWSDLDSGAPMKTKQWKGLKIKHRGDKRKAVLKPLPPDYAQGGERGKDGLWDRESGGWTDPWHAPAAGSELLRPQTSPSCGVPGQ